MEGDKQIQENHPDNYLPQQNNKGVEKQPDEELASSDERTMLKILPSIIKDNSIAPEQSETENQQPETQNMEVHHHPEVEKKGIKEYLLEGLMIFLAVTLGFFAENLREYFTDREKEVEYMHSLREDLQKDTIALNYSIYRLQQDINSGDSLIVMYAKNEFKGLGDETFSRLAYSSALSVDIIFNDRTSSQLKSSGSIRLIKHKNIADSIAQYWNNQTRLNQIHDRFESYRLKQRDLGFKSFNWYVINYRYGLGVNSSLYEVSVKAISDTANLNEFVNLCSSLFSVGGAQYMPILSKQLKLATQLIKEIQKEYPLENE